MTASVRAWGSLIHGTGDIVVTLATHDTGDILGIFAACDTDTVAAPAGWTVRGKGFISGALITFMTRDTYAASAAESSPTIADAGNHTVAVAVSIQGGDLELHRISGCSTVGSGTTGRTPSIRTDMDDILLLFAIGGAHDTPSAICSAVTNADIADIAEVFDAATDDGNGSAIVVATGTLATPGPIRQTEFTISAGNTAGLVVAIKPKRATAFTGTIEIAGSPAPDAADVVKIFDATQADTPVVASITGGAGGYSALVRYADHDYVAVYDDGTSRGASEANVA